MAEIDGSDIAEAVACSFDLRHALSIGYSTLVTEGDSLLVISKLCNKAQISSILGLFIAEIFTLVVNCSYFARSCDKRVGNQVAHEAAHCQSYLSGVRLWIEESSSSLPRGRFFGPL